MKNVSPAIFLACTAHNLCRSAWLRSKLDKPSHSLLLTAQCFVSADATSGYALLPLQNECGVAKLCYLHTLRKGDGAKILENMRQEARDLGYSKVVAHGMKVGPVLNFYRKHGFTVVDSIRTGDVTRSETHTLELELCPS